MLISDSKQVLIVHFPKTGGVSVEDTVREACPDARKARPALGRHATLARSSSTSRRSRDY